MRKKYRTLLTVVVGIGILGAILVPNLLDALQKAKQKRCIGDIRSYGTALFSFLTDPDGSPMFYITGDMWSYTDCWGNPCEVTLEPSHLPENVLVIRCFGRDGKEGGTGYDGDIVWADGFFVSHPTGAQVD